LSKSAIELYSIIIYANNLHSNNLLLKKIHQLLQKKQTSIINSLIILNSDLVFKFLLYFWTTEVYFFHLKWIRCWVVIFFTFQIFKSTVSLWLLVFSFNHLSHNNNNEKRNNRQEHHLWQQYNKQLRHVPSTMRSHQWQMYNPHLIQSTSTK
jgi:hypothetical protein